MKKLLTIIFILFITLNFSSICFSAPYISLNLNYDGQNHHYEAEEVYLYVNSKKLTDLTIPPIILNNYTLVPAREVFENLGATVDWDSENMQVQISYENRHVILQINNKIATVDGATKTMDLEAKLINSKTMIPVRFVGEAIGAEVTWENSNRSIYINMEKNDNIDTSIDQNLLNIINFKLPDSDEVYFKINLDKEIESFEESYNSEKEYTLSIKNSNYTLEKENFNSVVDSIKETNVYTQDGTTTFSFITNEKLNFKSFISRDKKSIFVTFGTNFLKNVELFSQGDTEVLKLNSDFELIFNTEKNVQNHKIIMELENCAIKNLSENIKYSNFIKNFKYYQYSEDLVKLEISLVENINDIDFSFESSNNTTFITFYEVSDNQLEYVNSENRITLKNNSSVNINDIEHNDNYLEKIYTLTFKTDISSLIDLGVYNINSNLVNNIEVTKNSIIINSNKIIAVNITNNNDFIYIDIVEPKEKYKNIVVLDPGHGGSDGGASANNLVEKNIVLDISNRLIKLLEEDSDIKVYASRTTDFYPSFDDRTSLANEIGDVFVSIHINAASNNTNAKGTEVYYLNENKSSSGLTSSFLAKTFQTSFIELLGTFDRKIKTSNFKVLRDTSIPAILCEVAFITNSEDASNLATESFRQKAAQAMYNSLKQVFTAYSSR